MTLKILGKIANPVNPDQADWYEQGALVVDDAGEIAYCGPSEDAPDADEILDRREMLILPGFVDAHCHVGQARAANLRYSQLLPWLEKVVFPLEIGYSRQVAEKEAPKFFGTLLANGTTCAGAYVTIREDATDQVFCAAEDAGIRAVIGKVMMDRHSPEGLLEDTRNSIEGSLRLCKKWHNAARGRLRYAFTPRFALTCSAELMQEAGRLADEHCAHIMTHVAENEAEVARAAELFPEARSYLDIYQRAGMLGPHTTLAHAIHLDAEDWERVEQSGSGIAHCPTSNLLLESGILDLSKPAARKIGLGLGSDIGAGSDPALPTVVASAVTSQSARKVLGHSHKSVTALFALYLLTLGGAQSMGLQDRTGSLDLGKAADFLVVDPRPCLPLEDWHDSMNLEAVLWALILRFRPSAIREAYVQGQRVHALEPKTTGITRGARPE